MLNVLDQRSVFNTFEPLSLGHGSSLYLEVDKVCRLMLGQGNWVRAAYFQISAQHCHLRLEGILGDRRRLQQGSLQSPTSSQASIQ